MLNTKKLLYILPDVAYVAELLPAKQPHTFAIQNFRQINGQFLDDQDFIPDNIQKLVNKLEADEYHVILPDFLFTNTIVEVKATAQTKIDAYIKDELLPSLEITPESHQTSTFVLTQHKSTSKVQLSAIENEALQPLALAVAGSEVKLSQISPLSWTIKAIVSLEPSITLVQLGSQLFLAQHYIGVDQATYSTIEDVEKLAETIRTLKGAEPSIQTLYLLTNPLVEEQLKSLLSDTLPLQQLTSAIDDSTEMPSFVKQIIETGMRTLDISDFPVPMFKLKKIKTEPRLEKTAQTVHTSPVITEVTTQNEDSAMTDAPMPAPSKPEVSTELEEKTDTLETVELETTDAPESTPTPEVELESNQPLTVEETPTPVSSPVPQEPKTTETIPTPVAAPTTPVTPGPITPPQRTIIKNKNNTGSMVRMIFVTIAVLFATVAIGVGVGLGLLKLSSGSENKLDTSPVVIETPTPEALPSPSPSPSPTAAVDPSQLSILVVNATTIAGKAGTIKADLEAAEFGTVIAGNAKGEYELGENYVLLKEPNAALVSALEAATKLEFTSSDEIAIEDAAGKHDAVVVFADNTTDTSKNETESE